MKLFISWSGKRSQKVAEALREWVPMVIQTVEPFVSSEDIEKGSRWGGDIATELMDTDCGIICMTPENVGAPWLNFEAGALSKSMEDGRVMPFLFGMSRSDVPPGPLVQFQSTLTDEGDVWKLVKSLNAANPDGGLDETRLRVQFDLLLPNLEERFAKIEPESDDPGVRRENGDVLAEVLEIVRSQQQRLNDPEAILPAGYLRHALRGQRHTEDLEMLAELLTPMWRRLAHATEGNPDTPPDVAAAIDAMDQPLTIVLRRLRRQKGGGRVIRPRPDPDSAPAISPADLAELRRRRASAREHGIETEHTLIFRDVRTESPEDPPDGVATR